jgi:predicted permease
MGRLSDLTYAVRILRRTPSFTWPAVASLALAIALNATMFSVVNAVLLRPLGRSGDGDLVRIGRSQRGDRTFRSATLEEFEYLRRHAATIGGLSGHQIESVTVDGPEGSLVASIEVVSASYFSVLGVAPRAGRDFGPAEEQAGGPPAVIISDRFWRRHFGRDVAAVGRPLSLNRHTFTIVGVAAAGFVGTFPGVDVDLWVPVTTVDLVTSQVRREPPALHLIARLNPGVSMASAAAELDVLARRRAEENPDRSRDRGFIVGSARGAHPALAGAAGLFVLLLMGVVGIVLLLACANVASLLLARASARHAELALRLALGAGRKRLVGQLLAESGVLAVLGAATGLGMSLLAVQSLNGLSIATGPTGTPIFLNLQLDSRVLAFTAALTILTTFAFGLVPALQASRADLISLLKHARVFGWRRSRLRGGLLVIQVALSCVLLIAAGLLFRSLRNAASLDVGFDPDRVTVTSFALQPFDRDHVDRFFDELLRRARLLPGVEHAALADFVPMGGRGSTIAVFVPGISPPSGGDTQRLPYNTVSDGYFATLRQPLARGRDFTSARASDGPSALIVNEALARQFWPDENPLGKLIRIEGEPAAREVVGVVRDARWSFGNAAGPFLYLQAGPRYAPLFSLHVRTSGGSSVDAARLRRLTAAVDAAVSIRDTHTLRDRMGFGLVPARIAQGVFTISGVIGLLLALGGLYGLVAYTLAQRLQEIGVRVALGATRGNLFRVIVGGAVRLTVIGVALGIGAAAAGTRLLSALLYGLSPLDPLTFGGIAGLLVLVTLLAGYAAARKGLTVDPVIALRHE